MKRALRRRRPLTFECAADVLVHLYTHVGPGLRACMRILQFPSDGRVDEMRLKLALSLGIPVVKIEVQVKVKGKIRVRVGMRDAVVKR